MKPLSELLRPTELADLIQPQPVICSLEGMIKRQSLQNMIFYGSPGAGKTSVCRMLTSKLNYEVMEINGSLSTSVDDVRARIEPFSSTTSLWGNRKVVLIEEAEYLSKAAQASLRGVIENFDDVRFLMTTNEIGKLDAAIQSRCLPVPFGVPRMFENETIERFLPRYQSRLKEAGYSIEYADLLRIIRRWFPDMRGAANEIEFAFAKRVDLQ